MLGLKDFLIFFVKKDFSKGKIDSTLFVKTKDNDMLLAQIYINDIILTNLFVKNFFNCMKSEFKMSMMDKLNLFPWTKIKQTKECIFINQEKYAKELVKKFKLQDAKTIGTPMSTSAKLDKMIKVKV